MPPVSWACCRELTADAVSEPPTDGRPPSGRRRTGRAGTPSGTPPARSAAGCVAPGRRTRGSGHAKPRTAGLRRFSSDEVERRPSGLPARGERAGAGLGGLMSPTAGFLSVLPVRSRRTLPQNGQDPASLVITSARGAPRYTTQDDGLRGAGRPHPGSESGPHSRPRSGWTGRGGRTTRCGGPVGTEPDGTPGLAGREDRLDPGISRGGREGRPDASAGPVRPAPPHRPRHRPPAAPTREVRRSGRPMAGQRRPWAGDRRASGTP
jgi:hypothetical protein